MGSNADQQSATAATVIRGDHKTFDWLTADESIHNLRNVRGRNAPVKKVIGFD